MKTLKLNGFTEMSREEAQTVEGGKYTIALAILSKLFGRFNSGGGGGQCGCKPRKPPRNDCD